MIPIEYGTTISGTIDATMELWYGSTLVDSWSDSDSTCLTLAGTHSVVSGRTYTLTVSGTAGGVAFTGTPVSVNLPVTCGQSTRSQPAQQTKKRTTRKEH